jgi:hypothetical protein
MKRNKTVVYPFEELSEDAKESAINSLRDINVGHDWWDSVEDDAKIIAALMGIDIDNIYFSGFASKGDGACFEGSYEYKKNSVAAVKSHAPQDKELHRIVNELLSLQKKCFFQIRANVKHSGHRFCTDISVDFESYVTGNDYYNPDIETDVIEVLRDYMLWIYKRLEAEYDYLVSDAAIEETIKANEYEFTIDGEKY